MVKRKIVLIDEKKCTGCGACIPNCPEGALQIVDGKAKLVSDKYCDGLGVCLKTCPEDAITIIEREAEEFDEEAVKTRLKKLKREETKKVEQASNHPHTCLSEKVVQFNKDTSKKATAKAKMASGDSELAQWPIQITLVPADASYLKDADLLIVADCVPFAYASFHQDLLKGKTLLVGCPKLDDPNFYIEKLAQVISKSDIKSITIAHMEVPCCFGLNHIVKQALASADKDTPVNEVNISIEGEVLSRELCRAQSSQRYEKQDRPGGKND